MKSAFEEMAEQVDKEYPHKIRSHHKLGCVFFLSRRNWGYDTLAADGMVVLGHILNVSYKYEPEYVQAHTASIGWNLGGGRWLSFSFSWPRL